MMRVRLSIQIALSLALLSATVIFAAKAIGLIPDKHRAEVTARIALCENLAVTSSVLANRQQWDGIQVSLRELKARNPQIITAGLRRSDDRMMLQIGNHEATWQHTTNRQSSESQIYVPILQGKTKWGSLEVAFQPLEATGFAAWLDFNQWKLVLFVVTANALIFLFYLGRVLYELDPQRVMPQRVRSAFDTLSEGLMVLDSSGRIVLANQALGAAIGRKPEDLIGFAASRLPFQESAAGEQKPWESVRQTSLAQTGVEMSLAANDGQTKTFFVNSAPIEDNTGKVCGVLASFADVTQLEQKKQDLLKILEVVRESRDKIRQQNTELVYLATRDSLTGCLNRRAFFEQFERIWHQGNGIEVSCIMCDIDKFKSINDNHGHSKGDEVLRRVAEVLLNTIGSDGLVCRYGGEEFCIVLTAGSLENALEVGERLRSRVAELEFVDLKVTSSFGVSSGRLGAESCQALLDQADKSLYYSKHNGRNRVTAWNHDGVADQVHEPEKRSEVVANVEPVCLQQQPAELQVPYHAVACLLRALAYRDPETASHSARVADLAVATARGLMSAGDAYLLEIAALLHDIGKIGVPDAILLKPGKLTPEEWQIMNLHARIGVEIVAASFDSPGLVDTVRFHHAFFGGNGTGDPKGCDIPLGARIVTICDAYDAMVSDRVYRKGRPPEVAFAELRRMGGSQFDPDLVERFIEIVSHRLSAAPQASVPINRELALNLGLQTERLAGAIDDLDFAAIRAVATHLKSTADAHGLDSLAAAAELLLTGAHESDMAQLADIVHEIITLSLTAQQAHLIIDDDAARAAQARGQSVVG
jgi:diguanylate cyclase (GGDEF)-like protein/PAS domain S-box-containing protein/putative nucleotidyltransferase with HDIG domain